MADFVNKTLDSMRAGPLGPALTWAEAHPRIAAWIVLALGMVILLVISAWNVGLLAGQWAALIIATVAVAGLCVWIISWEDEEDAEAEEATQKLAEDNKNR